jgi:hypothetical protein
VAAMDRLAGNTFWSRYCAAWYGRAGSGFPRVCRGAGQLRAAAVVVT